MANDCNYIIGPSVCQRNRCDMGECVARDEDDYTCECYDGFYGRFCDKKRKLCLSEQAHTQKSLDNSNIQLINIWNIVKCTLGFVEVVHPE